MKSWKSSSVLRSHIFKTNPKTMDMQNCSYAPYAGRWPKEHAIKGAVKMWKYFFPDEGEALEDARDFPKSMKIFGAEHAAQNACELDFNNHDGWERGETEFAIAVVAPDGTVHKFRGRHEPSVEHYVSEYA